MEINFLKQYIDNNIKFCQTVVIKSKKTAELINQKIELDNKISLSGESESNFKYYLNIAGEYHPEYDEEMYILSLDTLDKILFSKENLENNTVTKNNYQFGSIYYEELVKKYPSQKRLIFGIVYPVDLDKVLEADDLTIINYIPSLIEEQEITLIDDFNKYLINYEARWNVESFSISDSYYNIAYEAIKYLNLVPKLFNLRLTRCKTPEAHSFHIREYLASNGGLATYIPYMTKKQILFLYRNINYIQRHSGSSKQFSQLIEKFFFDIGISLSTITVKHKVELNDDLSNGIIIKKENLDKNNAVVNRFVDMDTMRKKIVKLAPGNEEFYSTDLEIVDSKLKTSLSGTTLTKLLESEYTNKNNLIPELLKEVVYRELLTLLNNKKYGYTKFNISKIIEIKDPKTQTVYRLSYYDTFIFLYYIIIKSLNYDSANDAPLINYDNTKLPYYNNLRQRKIILPTVDQMLLFVGISESDNYYQRFKDIAKRILLNKKDRVNLYSTDEFKLLIEQELEEELLHWGIISREENHMTVAIVENMINFLYTDEIVKLNLNSHKSLLVKAVKTNTGTENNREGIINEYDYLKKRWVYKNSVSCPDHSNNLNFGDTFYVSDDNTTLIVSGLNFTDDSDEKNRIYTFDKKNNNLWEERRPYLPDSSIVTTRINITSTGVDDNFGISMLLSSDKTILVVGASKEIKQGSTLQGAVHTFLLNDNNIWIKSDTIYPSGDQRIEFGINVTGYIKEGDLTNSLLLVNHKDTSGKELRTEYTRNSDNTLWVKRNSTLTQYLQKIPHLISRDRETIIGEEIKERVHNGYRTNRSIVTYNLERGRYVFKGYTNTNVDGTYRGVISDNGKHINLSKTSSSLVMVNDLYREDGTRARDRDAEGLVGGIDFYDRDKKNELWTYVDTFIDAEHGKLTGPVYLNSDDYLESWLNSKNIHKDVYTKKQYDYLVKDILLKLTGINDIESINSLLKEKTMLEILDQLTSYSTTIIPPDLKSLPRIVNWKAIRADLNKQLPGERTRRPTRSLVKDNIQNKGIKIIKIDNTFYHKNKITIPNRNIKMKSNNSIDIKINLFRKYDSKNPLKRGSRVLSKVDMLSKFRILSVNHNSYNEDVSSDSAFIGYENYLSLNNKQRNKIKSIH